MRLNRNYLIAASILFGIELHIAICVHDDFVRPYIGDVLVVMLIYCVVKGCIRIGWCPAVIGVSLFAFSVEWLQYLKVVYWLGLEKSLVAKTMIGTSFSWIDMVCYVMGGIGVAITEITIGTIRKTA